MLLAPRGGLANAHPARIAHHPTDASARTHFASFFEARVGSKSQNLTATSLQDGRSGMLLAPRGGLANAHPSAHRAPSDRRIGPNPLRELLRSSRGFEIPEPHSNISSTDGVGCSSLREEASRTNAWSAPRITRSTHRPKPTSRASAKLAWVRNPRTSQQHLFDGRSGIRTHAGFRPHDFQSCALSHSAIRPLAPEGAPHDRATTTEGVGCSSLREEASRTNVSRASRTTRSTHRPKPTLRASAKLAWVRNPRTSQHISSTEGVGCSSLREEASRTNSLARIAHHPFDASAQTHVASFFEARVGSNPRTSQHISSTEGVGFEPTRSFRTNALAGRRLKPLGHPSKADRRTAGPAVPISCPARART